MNDLFKNLFPFLYFMGEFGELVIFSGSANQLLAKRIAAYLKQPLGKAEIKRFKDGETYCRIEENVRGKDIFLVQPTSSPVNDNLMELVIMIDAFRRASAARITAVIPYYGYARQDRKAKSREPITAKLVANLITACGANRVMTLDLHADQIQGFFDIPLDHLYALPLFESYLSEKNHSDLIIVSPDVGGAKKANFLAKKLDVPLAILDKRREKHNEVSEMVVVGDVKGKECILVDDMIDTAGTISEAAKTLKQNGAKKVSVIATHGIFSEPALERLSTDAIEEVIVTDSINHKKGLPSKISVLSVAPLLGEAISAVHSSSSISELMDKKFNIYQLSLNEY
jgi:ribose-phosphate pyrophosphokinase